MINVTESAKEKLIIIIDEEKVKAVRFGLQGGGCSGFTYFFTLEQEIYEDDLQVQLDANHIMVIDAMSCMYLEGSQVDYRSDVMGDKFVFDNPNAVTHCGCGSSVSFD